MKYFYVDSTGYVSIVLFTSLSDCLSEIRSTLTLKSFSDVSYFNIYGFSTVANRVTDGFIRSLFMVYRDGALIDSVTCKQVGDNFKIA